MKTRLLSLSLLCAVLATFLPGVGRAGEPSEIVLKRYSEHFLFFLDEPYTLSAGVSAASVSDAGPVEGKSKITRFNVTFKADKVGIQEIPEVRFECQGVRYAVPAHQIVVLGTRPQQVGVFVESASDPNGSHQVEVVLVANLPESKANSHFSLDSSKLPEGIKVISNGSSSSTSDGMYNCVSRAVLLNTTDVPFVLGPDLYKNLPPPEHWPTIEIPPAIPKA